MQTVANPEEVLAFAISDIHASDKKPHIRAEKPEEWFGVMEGYFDNLYTIMSQYQFKERNIPLLIAGDIFDHYDPSPETVNFMIRMLKHYPRVYAIPGQHDLPFHRLQDLKKSGYWTLHEAGAITDLSHYVMDGKNLDFRVCHSLDRYDADNTCLRIVPFPWGRNQAVDVEAFSNVCAKGGVVFNGKSSQHRTQPIYNIALIHRYLYHNHAHPGARREDRCTVALQPFEKAGFHFAISGDNHLPWHTTLSRICDFRGVNCGTFMRRKKDEINTIPRVCVLSSEHIGFHNLDVSQDQFINEESAGLKEDNLKIRELVESLSKTIDAHDDFLRQLLDAAAQNSTVAHQQLQSIVKELEHADS